MKLRYAIRLPVSNAYANMSSNISNALRAGFSILHFSLLITLNDDLTSLANSLPHFHLLLVLPFSIFLFHLFATIPLLTSLPSTSSTKTSPINNKMAPNTTLSARDVEVLAAAFQCQKSPPEVSRSAFLLDLRLVSIRLDDPSDFRHQHSSTAQSASLHFCAPDPF